MKKNVKIKSNYSPTAKAKDQEIDFTHPWIKDQTPVNDDYRPTREEIEML